MTNRVIVRDVDGAGSTALMNEFGEWRIVYPSRTVVKPTLIPAWMITIARALADDIPGIFLEPEAEYDQ